MEPRLDPQLLHHSFDADDMHVVPGKPNRADIRGDRGQAHRSNGRNYLHRIRYGDTYFHPDWYWVYRRLQDQIAESDGADSCEGP